MSRTAAPMRRPGVVTLGLVAGILSLVGVGTCPAVAGAATEGAAYITRVGALTPLHSGGSATPFGVALPPGAACPGDSAHDGYRVDSYLVPKGASPTEANYGTGIPSRWWGYFSSYGQYVGAANTAEGTGAVIGLPNSFTWTRLTAAELLPGGVHSATWEGGIACADVHGKVTTFWNTEIVFTADPSDPGGFTWRVVHEGAVPSPSDTGLWVGVGLLVVASLSAAYALHLRRRGRSGGSESATPDGDGDGGPVAARRPAVPQHSG